MNNSGSEFSLRNLLNNLTTAQKLGIGLGFVIFALMLVFVGFLASDRENGEQSVGESAVEETEEVYTDENGYTVTKKTYIDESGETVTEGTKEDADGNVTTIDPGLITTYFPYQVSRKHKESNESTLRYFLSIDEETKTINALVEECDVAGDQALVQEYINSVPLDLSAYTVVYETFSNNASCVD